jgi:uncharacterized damage-inducible protein DinB
MKKTLVAIALALVIGALPALTQDQAKGLKPPPSSSQVLLDSWNDNGRKLIAMAEDFPEDKYEFKPNPVERSFAEQLLHAANANYYFINAFTGQKMPDNDPKRDQLKTKAQVVAFVKKAFGDGAALIKQKGDSGMNDVAPDPFTKGQQVRFSDLAWGFVEHSGEHYGQLVVYYRVAGLVPPESRPKK